MLTTPDRVPGRPTILVVEDDDLLRALPCDLLAGRGDRVFSASDGRYAFELTVEHRPHAIVLDPRLSITSGWLVLERLRASALTRHIPVLALSADPEAAGDSAGAAADVYVGMPFDVDVLLQQVEVLVRRGAGASPLLARA
jgi:DNA-binding response OmpR family regulator